MSAVQIVDLRHEYVAGDADAPAVNGVSLTIEQGEFYTLLGPSGCGKTTTLRCIAGLERPTSGQIILGDQEVFSPGHFVPTHKRDIGMVYQDYAVWPHMTVFENVAFPLKVGKTVRGQARKDRVMEMLTLVGLETYAQRRATELSGGQQQRLSLARALVREPSVLLLDEPLSNLDAQLREQMRDELRQIQRRVGVTTIFVTHDQVEALAMSTHVAVMRGGKVEQVATPRELYEHPTSEFVATFVGKTTLIKGTVSAVGNGKSAGTGVLSTGLGELKCRLAGDVSVGAPATLAIRPENIRLHATDEGLTENCSVGQVERSVYFGEAMDYQISANGELLKATGTPKSPFKQNDKVYVELPAADCVLLPS